MSKGLDSTFRLCYSSHHSFGRIPKDFPGSVVNITPGRDVLCLLPPPPKSIVFQPLGRLPGNAALIAAVPAACLKAECRAMLAEAEK